MINKRNGVVALTLVSLFLSLFFAKYFVRVNTLYTNIALIIIGGLCYLFTIFCVRHFDKKLLILFSVDLIALLSCYLNKNFPISYWVLAMAFQGFSLIFVYSEAALQKQLFLVFNVFSVAFVVTVAGAIVFEIDLNTLFNKASENFISIVLLSCLCVFAYYIFKFHPKRKPIIFIMWAICQILCFFTNGRAGILVFLILGFAFLFICFPFKQIILFRAVIIASLSLLIFLFFEPIKVAVDNALASEGRFYLWSTYLDSTFSSPKNFLFGTQFSNNRLFILWNKNLHNSFLEIHLMYGLVPLLILLVALASRLFKKGNPLLKVFIICILIRGMSDSFFFGEICDVPLYLFALEGCLEAKRVFPKKKTLVGDNKNKADHCFNHEKRDYC